MSHEVGKNIKDLVSDIRIGFWDAVCAVAYSQS